ncbi:MAG: hypothetical protein JRC99_00045 [Deltaproteobacteria bacterium]|nr:hypothetical protein [Deltaproteobacteria bacterium]
MSKTSYTYTVHYTDDSSGIVELERPPGAHPDSTKALVLAIKKAEALSGVEVERIGRSEFFAGKILDSKIRSRSSWVELYKKQCIPLDMEMPVPPRKRHGQGSR